MKEKEETNQFSEFRLYHFQGRTYRTMTRERIRIHVSIKTYEWKRYHELSLIHHSHQYSTEVFNKIYNAYTQQVMYAEKCIKHPR